MTTATGQVAVNFVGTTDENPWVDSNFTVRSGGTTRIEGDLLKPNAGTGYFAYTGGSYSGDTIVVSAEVHSVGSFDECYIGALDENGDGIMLWVSLTNVFVVIIDNYTEVDSAGSASNTFVADDLFEISITKGTPNTYSVKKNGTPLSISASSYAKTLSNLEATWSLVNGNVGASSFKSIAVVSGLSGGVGNLSLDVDSNDLSMTGQEIPFIMTVPGTEGSIALQPFDVGMLFDEAYTLPVSHSPMALEGQEIPFIMTNPGVEAKLALQSYNINMLAAATLLIDYDELTIESQDVTLKFGGDTSVPVDGSSIALAGSNILPKATGLPDTEENLVFDIVRPFSRNMTFVLTDISRGA
jgi:hypothetical protein